MQNCLLFISSGRYSEEHKYSGNEEYIETFNIDESGGLKQADGMNQQIVCITGDDNNYRQIEIEEYNEDQLEEDCLDGSTSYERLPSGVSQKQQKNENVYILSGTAHSSISSQDEPTPTTMRHNKILNSQAHQMAMHNDPDERFLLSCLPIMKRLPNKKNALARLKIQQLLFDIEFENDVNN